MNDDERGYRIADRANPFTTFESPKDYRIVFYYSRKFVSCWCSHKRHHRDESKLPRTPCAIPNCRKKFCVLCRDNRPEFQPLNYCQCHQIHRYIESEPNILAIGLGPATGDEARTVLNQVVDYQELHPEIKFL